MDEIVINGTTYVKKTEPTNHVCVIAPNGWIFEGYREPSDEGVKLSGASVVRKWSNGLGIGGIAKIDHKDDYTLDAVGSITITDVTAVIDLEW